MRAARPYQNYLDKVTSGWTCSSLPRFAQPESSVHLKVTGIADLRAFPKKAHDRFELRPEADSNALDVLLS